MLVSDHRNISLSKTSGVKMNGVQSRKVNRIEKPVPGCLGSMVNLFDFTENIPGNKLLIDGPRREGSFVGSSQSDLAKMSSPTFGDQIEDKKIVSELRRASSDKKVNGTPMKMLIAQEMTKDVDGKRGSPSLVAKLMGLEALPQQQPESAALRSRSKAYSQNALSSGTLVECWQQDCFSNKDMHYDTHPCPEKNFGDVHEIWKQSIKPNHVRENSSEKGRDDEKANEKNIALIRQKFMEVKRMSLDEKLRQSKEYYDALEVLSSNRELFVKFLQEPNSKFSPSLAELKSIPTTPEAKRITVLKPSMRIDNQKFTGSAKQNDEPTNRSPQVFQTPGPESDRCSYYPTFDNHKFNEHPAHPTRIVVLKPTPMKASDIKEPVSSPCASPRIEGFGEGPENVETRYPRDMAKKITQNVCENLIGRRRDETLLSSVYSNGYVGDESSSFNKSDSEYGAGSLSDSDVMSPTSRHSWDYVNKFGSPYSCSSFSQASCSPESSVCREAKKRLSERWAMMASNGNSHEKHVRKSSSTLGEMLALFDTKKSIGYKLEETHHSSSRLTSDPHESSSSQSQKNHLSRSKSLPVSATVSDVRVNNEATDPETKKTHNSVELMKSKSTKLSLKGKVSGIFFSRNKETSKEEHATAYNDESLCGTAETSVHSSGKTIGMSIEFLNNSDLEEGKSSYVCQSLSVTSPPESSGIRQNCGMFSQESQLSVSKVTCGSTSEKSDQPSPISVLEPPFDEGNNATGAQLLTEPLRSNVIDKCPPIGSIARTLSWDDSCSGTATYPLEHSLSMKGLANRENLFFLVRKLLVLAGLDGEMLHSSPFARWHSHESPLDPSLRKKDVNFHDKEALHEGKQGQAGSSWKLVFDCVNTALVEISENQLDRSIRGRPCGESPTRLKDGGMPKLVDCVWARVKEWFSDEEIRVPVDDGAVASLFVERAVNKEVIVGDWFVQMRLEVDILSNDIAGKLLEELVEETIIDLTGTLR